MIQILIVEDEQHIADLLITNLELEGYACQHAATISDAQKILLNADLMVDIVLLDVMLPDGNGYEFCKMIKSFQPNLPVLILSALGQSADRIIGLKSGADDYLAKPFNLEELLLRIALLKGKVQTSSATTLQQTITIGSAKINLADYTITVNHQITKLTSKEKELLEYFYKHRGKVISREELLEHVWHYDVFPTSRTIDNYIVKLRNLIEDDNDQTQMLTTIRGVGYKLELGGK